jgi:hypothetical protein
MLSQSFIELRSKLKMFFFIPSGLRSPQRSSRAQCNDSSADTNLKTHKIAYRTQKLRSDRIKLI